MKIVDVTPKNAIEETFFCIKDTKRQGFKDKFEWFQKRYKEGVRIKILKDEKDKMLGFMEYVSADYAWRPIEAKNYMFIHCLYIYSKKERSKGYGTMLIELAKKDANEQGMDGLCAITSTGGWLATKSIFEANNFKEVEVKDRFELMVKSWNKKAVTPRFLDWHAQQKKYQGWHLIYADQCPWNEKSAEAILNVAMDYEIDLHVTKINTPKEAKMAPSGFGVFNLLRDGRLLEDHYISHTRFRNILKKELNKV